MKTNILTRFIIASICIIILSIHCSSIITLNKRYNNIEQNLKTKNFNYAIKTIKKAKKEKKYTKKDRLLYYLDLGILYFYNKQWKESNELFEDADRAIENLYTKSISKIAQSFLLNDNVLEYSGEDYESVYINIFKCLNYIHLNKLDDAFVEIRRLNEKIETMSLKYDNLISKLNKLKKIKDLNIQFHKGKIAFHNSALAKYLSLLMYRAERKYDDANIDLESIKNLWKLQPNIYNFQEPEVVKNSLKNKNKTKLNLVCFTGLGPEKYTIGFEIKTFNGYIIVKNLRNNQRDKIFMDVKKDYFFKFSLPEIKSRPSKIKSIQILVNTEKMGKMELIENMSNVAIATYKLKQPIIYLKTIARTIAKGLVAQKQKHDVKKNVDSKILGDLISGIVDAAVDISENADLRCWRLMPGKCYVGELILPSGTYNIEIQYLDSSDRIIDKYTVKNFSVKPNRLNLINSFSFK